MAALVLLLLCSATAAAQEHLTVFHLHHRLASELVPVIRPLLGSDGAVSASGDKLIVRAAPDRLKEVAGVIEQLDVPATRLIILVRQGSRDGDAAQAGNATGVRRDGEEYGLFEVYSTGRREGGEMRQSGQSIEGHWAHINLGQAVPIGQRRTIQSGGTTATEESVQYIGVTSGFDVRARVSGDQVLVDIRPYRAQLAPEGGGRIDIQSLTTTVNGQLGEWIELGSHVQQTQQNGGGLVFSTRRDAEYKTHTYLKVERVANPSDPRP